LVQAGCRETLDFSWCQLVRLRGLWVTARLRPHTYHFSCRRLVPLLLPLAYLAEPGPLPFAWMPSPKQSSGRAACHPACHLLGQRAPVLNFAWIQMSEDLNNGSAQGMTHQNIWRSNLGSMQKRMQLG